MARKPRSMAVYPRLRPLGDSVGSGSGRWELDVGEGRGEGRALEGCGAGAGVEDAAEGRGAGAVDGAVAVGVVVGVVRRWSDRAARLFVARACAVDAEWRVAPTAGPATPSSRRCDGTFMTCSASTLASVKTPTRPPTASLVGDVSGRSRRSGRRACLARREDAIRQLSHLPCEARQIDPLCDAQRSGQQLGRG